MTELQKLQNRMAFGQEEEEATAFDETTGLGMAGSSSGRLRQIQGKSKSKVSKTNRNRLAQLRGSSSAQQSGLASSISFTPHQGVEFVDPTRQKKVENANDSWFAEGQFSVASRPTAAGSSMVPAIKRER